MSVKLAVAIIDPEAGKTYSGARFSTAEKQGDFTVEIRDKDDKQWLVQIHLEHDDAPTPLRLAEDLLAMLRANPPTN